MSIWRWAEFLDPIPEAARITLGEGQTPLLRSRSIGPKGGFKNLYFKLETTNPSGSYKDRFAAPAVSHLLARGKKVCVASSSGNTGAALAAYCAAAGVPCSIALVETAPEGKLKQMLAYGARLFRVKGFGLSSTLTAKTLEILQSLGNHPDASFEISAFRYSPVGMSGVRSMAHELAEQLESLDHVFCMAGGGGLAMGMAEGFLQLRAKDPSRPIPTVELVQPEGNDTIATPLREGAERARDIECTTLISGLQVASVTDGHLAIPPLRATGGTGHLVSDAEVWAMQQRLAREEGIFSEPAGATALPAIFKAAERGEISRDATIVCVISGSAFKDPPSMDKMLAGATAPIIDSSELERRVLDVE